MVSLKYDNLLSELNRIGLKIVEDYKTKLSNGDSVASGKLYESIDYKIVKTQKGFELVFLALDYYINIEEGRVKGMKMPPLVEIRNWIINKGLPNTKGLDFVIARSIKNKGIKPKPYLRDIESELNKYTNNIEEALLLDFKEITNNLKIL